MSKLVRSLALMTALAALSAGTVSVAQDKKAQPPVKKADDKKADDKKKAEVKAGRIEVYKNDKGNWRYKVVDENDKTIALPLANKSFESKEEVLKAIEVLKKVMSEAKPEVLEDKKK